MAAEAEAFLQRFLLPLVTGDELHVSEPLDARDLAALTDLAGLPDDAVVAVEAARQRRAEDLWPEPLDTRLDPAALELAVATHNLLYLGHPANERWTVTRRSLQRVTEFTQRCLQQPPPGSPAELVLRETVTGNLPWLTRTDVQVGYWAGRRTFRGQQPPARLLVWPRLRRVTEQRSQIPWLGPELAPAQLELVGLLLRHSPLTDLLSPWRLAPPFDWQPLLPWLRWPGICRLVCHEYLRQGLERVQPALARAFWRLLSLEHPQPRRQALEITAGLVTYLLAASALAAPSQAAPPAPDVEPADSLGAVLLAAAGCGLYPGRQALGDEPVSGCLDRWIADYRVRLGETGSSLAASLQQAIS